MKTLLILLAIGSVSCLERQACSYATLSKIGAECALRIERECKDKPEEDCPAVAECDALTEEWFLCR